jgi:hypothetical protein
VREIEYDEQARWLIVRRGPCVIAANFGSGPISLPCQGQAIELATDGEAHLAGGYLKLPPMSGALIR